jgi:hypothetical protein
MRHLSLIWKTTPIERHRTLSNDVLAPQSRLTGFCCAATLLSAPQKEMPGNLPRHDGALECLMIAE